MNMNMHTCTSGLQPFLRDLPTDKYNSVHQHGMKTCHLCGTTYGIALSPAVRYVRTVQC